MKKIVKYIYQTPVAKIVIKANASVLTELNIINTIVVEQDWQINPVIEKTVRQLEEYFSGERESFQLPLGFHYYTEFQRLVWKALLEIPYGSTRSYKEIAKAIGKPASCRAVGNACGQNRFPIIVPCHRVVAADGKIGGFSAELSIKRYLLKLEGNNK